MDNRSSEDEWVPASDILPETVKLTGRPAPVGVRRLLDRAASGAIPEMEFRGNRWGCWRSALPRVAARLGMRAPGENTERAAA